MDSPCQQKLAGAHTSTAAHWSITTKMLRYLPFAILMAGSSVWSQQEAPYGLDCSFPIHSTEFRCGDLLGDRKAFYDNFMEGCRKNAGFKARQCDDTEDDRLVMNFRQPQSMVNYTSTGYKKSRASDEVMKLLTEHWQKNKDRMTLESWPIGSIYVNHWESPTYMVSVEDSKFRGGGHGLKAAIWDAVKPAIEQWTGMEQQPTSIYGIRAYTNGALLSPHADRLPLVSSCIINVDQDVDEPWPLEVYDRDANAVNVTMEPGDMVFYESGSLIHGRPFPLKGRHYANIFIHFEPTGRKLYDHSDAYLDTLDELLPPYLRPGSPEVDFWLLEHPEGWRKTHVDADEDEEEEVTMTEGHHAASLGDMFRLEELAENDKMALHAKDENGWQPIHEAARGGFKEVVEMLLEHGADKNARVGPNGEGGSLLNVALEYHEEDHPLIQYLLDLGALDIEMGQEL